MRVFFILIFLLLAYPAFSQFTSAEDSAAIIIKTQMYQGLAQIPEQGQASFLVALSHFPELSNSRIKLKNKKIRTTLNVRPTICSLIFNRRENRKYIIRINSSTRDSIITLYELPSDVQVGVLGHELSHIADYRMKTIWGVISRGFAYMSKRRKANYEREMDSLTIKHGLGYELYQWSYYVLYDSDASSKYKLFKRSVYMKPEEILDLEKAGGPNPR